MADRRSADYDDKRDVDKSQPTDVGGRITQVLTPNEARQGTTHLGMRLVLVVSLAGAVIVLAIAYFAFFPATDGIEPPLPPEPPPVEQPSQ